MLISPTSTAAADLNSLKHAVLYDFGDSTDVVVNSTNNEFWTECYSQGKPGILRNLSFGDCMSKWTAHYLRKALGEYTLSVHVGETSSMNFVDRNFRYHYTTGDKLMRALSSTLLPEEDPKIFGKKMYYRATGRRPQKDTAMLHHLPGDIHADFVLPPALQFPPQNVVNDIGSGRDDDSCRLPYRTTKAVDVQSSQVCNDTEILIFSEVLRLSSPNLELWTHYDTPHNYLFQVGNLRILDSSSPFERVVQRLYDPDFTPEDCAPDLLRAYSNPSTRYCILHPGDILYIPPLWLHAVFMAPATAGQQQRSTTDSNIPGTTMSCTSIDIEAAGASAGA
eukprot:Lankesteria_metandrocarpae@DN2070_c0_g1_i2.p1